MPLVVQFCHVAIKTYKMTKILYKLYAVYRVRFFCVTLPKIFAADGTSIHTLSRSIISKIIRASRSCPLFAQNKRAASSDDESGTIFSEKNTSMISVIRPRTLSCRACDNDLISLLSFVARFFLTNSARWMANCCFSSGVSFFFFFFFDLFDLFATSWSLDFGHPTHDYQ